MQLDRLDGLANDAFAGRFVRKDLVRQVKVGANVPVYVLEFLLGKYCASDVPSSIEAGLAVVNQTLRENFIRPDESELAKARVKQKGEYRLIDKVDVRLLAREDKFWAHLQNFNDKFVHVPESLVYTYDRLLQGGAWCQLDLLYNPAEDEAQKRPFYIRALKPIQVAAFDLDEFVAGRRGFGRDDWLDLVVRTVGLEPRELDLRGKLLALCRLVPMAERNFNMRLEIPGQRGLFHVEHRITLQTCIRAGRLLFIMPQSNGCPLRPVPDPESAAGAPTAAPHRLHANAGEKDRTGY